MHYNVKRITNGNITVFPVEKSQVGPNGKEPSQLFQEAVRLSRCPSSSDEFEDFQPMTLEQLKQQSFQETPSVESTTEESPAIAHQVSGITVISNAARDGGDLVLLGADPGTHQVADALGVLVYRFTNDDQQLETHYDFIYPGEQLYVTDRYNNTVQSLR